MHSLAYHRVLLYMTYWFIIICWDILAVERGVILPGLTPWPYTFLGSSCYGVACVFDWFLHQFKRISQFWGKLLAFFDLRLKSCLPVACFFGNSRLKTYKLELPTTKMCTREISAGHASAQEKPFIPAFNVGRYSGESGALMMHLIQLLAKPYTWGKFSSREMGKTLLTRKLW